MALTSFAPVRMLRDAARARAAGQLRIRLSGADPSARARTVWGSPGPRQFTATDPIWRVHGDATMYLAGLRALMLQALHPIAMAGVAQNSTYEDDPWLRLQQISGFIAMTTYGSIDDATRAMDRVRGVHRYIKGSAMGRDYRADDPDLLLWVHCAEIDSFLDAYQRFSRSPLSPTEADAYVAQAAVAARGIGVPDPPTDVASLRGVLASYRSGLVGGPDARGVARFLRRPSELDHFSRVGYSLLYAGAVATLPSYARELLGLDWSRARTALALRAGQRGVDAIAWMLSDPLIERDRRTFDQLDPQEQRSLCETTKRSNHD